MAITAARCRWEYTHEDSHSSLDFVYGCCRFYVGKKHAINHQHYDTWFDYRSSNRCRARDHVHPQSQTQTYLATLGEFLQGHLGWESLAILRTLHSLKIQPLDQIRT